MIRRAAIATRGRPTPACSGIAIRPTIVHGNTDGNNLVIDVHVQELAGTPLLAEGDLLVFRGDVVQKPQDIHAECIDVSFRMIDPDQLLVRSRLAVGGFTKYESMINNRVTYHAPLDAFDVAGRPELTAGELAPIYDGMLRDALDRPIVSIPRFLPALTRGCIA